MFFLCTCNNRNLLKGLLESPLLLMYNFTFTFYIYIELIYPLPFVKAYFNNYINIVPLTPYGCIF